MKTYANWAAQLRLIYGAEREYQKARDNELLLVALAGIESVPHCPGQCRRVSASAVSLDNVGLIQGPYLVWLRPMSRGLATDWLHLAGRREP